MSEILQQFDLWLLLVLNGSDSLYLDGVMWAVTRTATWSLLFCALFYVVVKNNSFRQTAFILFLVVLLILLADQMASGVCKPYFQRFRPSRDPDVGHLIDVVNGYRGGKYGFFSSHASNTFAVATFFSLLFRRQSATICLYLWAVLCSYSRLYLGVHYPSDIFVGLCFGSLSGYVFYRIHQVVSVKCFSGFSSTRDRTVSSMREVKVLLLAFILTCVYIAIRALWYAAEF